MVQPATDTRADLGGRGIAPPSRRSPPTQLLPYRQRRQRL